MEKKTYVYEWHHHSLIWEVATYRIREKMSSYEEGNKKKILGKIHKMKTLRENRNKADYEGKDFKFNDTNQ